MYASTIALLAALSASVIAKTIPIDVGKTGLVFSPNTTTADMGDILEFHFYNSEHTVVEGDFSTPCQMGSLVGTGFDSGPIKDTSSFFQVTVSSTNPIWYYCSVPGHCSAGMVAVVNPPSSGGNSLDAYKSAAKSASSAQGLSTVQGGSLVPASSAASGSTGAAATTAATTTGSGTSAPGSASASQTGTSSTTSATAAASPTSGGMALMETGDKVALTSVLVGLGLLVVLMV